MEAINAFVRKLPAMLSRIYTLSKEIGSSQKLCTQKVL